MPSTRTPRSLLILVIAAVMAGVALRGTTALTQTPVKEPYPKAQLLRLVQLNGLSPKEFVQYVERRGVAFEMTPAVEQEFARAGATPAMLNVIRSNYRPPASPAATAAAGGSSSADRPAATAAANTGGAVNVPSGAPLSKNEIVTLLQSGVPVARIEKFVEVRGVSFSISAETAQEIKTAGGTNSLIGAIAANVKEGLSASAAGYGAPSAAATEPSGGPTYDELTDRAIGAFRSNDTTGAIRYLQQALTMDQADPRAYQLIGLVSLYGARNFPVAERAMRAALERGGSGVFRVYHDHDGSFRTYCEGSFFVSRSGVSFRANDGNDTFEADDANIKEAKLNSFMGLQYGAFHVRLTKEAGGRNYNFAPATQQKAESNLIVNLIQSYQ